jgi:hypothetical protein
MAQALQALCTFSERKFRLNSTAEGSHTSILSEKTLKMAYDDRSRGGRAQGCFWLHASR